MDCGFVRRCLGLHIVYHILRLLHRRLLSRYRRFIWLCPLFSFSSMVLTLKIILSSHFGKWYFCIFGTYKCVQRPGFTTGNRVFAESNILRWELNLKLSTKISLARVKTNILGEEKNSRRRISSPRAKKYSRRRISSPRASRLALGEEILHREFFYCSRRRNFKKSLFHLQFFSIINMHLYKGYF
jgi:hypothetical protein